VLCFRTGRYRLVFGGPSPRIPGTRRRSGHREQLHAARDGDYRLWHVGAGGRCRTDRCGAPASSAGHIAKRFQAKACPGLDPRWPPVRRKRTRQKKDTASILMQSRPIRLTAPPIAVDVRHNHRAARPVFLHVSCVAISHRIAAGEIPGVDVVGLALVARINAQAWPPDPALRRRLGDHRPRRLRRPHPRRRRLGLDAGCGQRKTACKNQPYCRRPDPHHLAHPKLFNGCKVSDCRANVNCA
jgi:hypothetical protein